MNEISFEDGAWGTKATIIAPWNDSFLPYLLDSDIKELELNLGKGWRGKNIEFLYHLPQLRSLIVLDLTLEAIEPVHALQNLAQLTLSTYSDIPVDFNNFPHLQSCYFEWIKGSESLFDRESLNGLGLNNYRGSSSKEFAKLKKLEKLTILNSGMEDLTGLWEPQIA